MREVFLVVSIDCECDKGPGWRVRSPLAFEGVRDGVGRRLAPLFRRFEAKATYLLSPEVLRDDASATLFRTLSAEADLGTHLHGEYADPHAFEPDVTRAFQRDYPADLERAKLASLTGWFKDAFGRAPRAFRAGRFGVGAASLGHLMELGYAVDSSVTPHESWEGAGAPGLSFAGAPTQPYHPAVRDAGVPGDAPILEVPITIRPHRFARLPLLGRVLAPRWLRPTRQRRRALLDVAREEIREAGAARGPVVLNAMLHNVEVVAGTSPYARTERAARRILDRLGALLDFASRESIRVIGLSDVPELFA